MNKMEVELYDTATQIQQAKLVYNGSTVLHGDPGLLAEIARRWNGWEDLRRKTIECRRNFQHETWYHAKDTIEDLLDFVSTPNNQTTVGDLKPEEVALWGNRKIALNRRRVAVDKGYVQVYAIEEPRNSFQLIEDTPCRRVEGGDDESDQDL